MMACNIFLWSGVAVPEVLNESVLPRKALKVAVDPPSVLVSLTSSSASSHAP